ncbi:M1 family metallopeptidase [Nocardioides sp. R-C-SC26]|uniref:M1 family metallopeptidase n=1 Tax=Nocardioides sp. R-C-SC26 TaxID=2870414 RepID=UPI001E2BEE73|nr:M1 family metallopeptidase [Nocardioides sp. R-C-SC26]
MTRLRSAVTAPVVALAAGCSAGPDDEPSEPRTPSGPEVAAATPTPAGGEPVADDPAYDVALSEPTEDSYYPEVGDPGVDALHYGLDLVWQPRAERLLGDQTLVFRATSDAPRVQLDLSDALTVRSARLDGVEVPVRHRGKDLAVLAPVAADQRYRLDLTYAGTPEPVPAPSTRSDVEELGFTIDEHQQAWTMQEPYGAFTWYAVNDQPSDKALYDFTLTTASPWLGVANGRLVADSGDDAGPTRTTRWHLATPAASYLVTVAFGDYDLALETGPRGLPIAYLTPRGEDSFDTGLRSAPAVLGWLEERLGPYPFDSLGFVVVDSTSAMETQTMVTLGATDYATSPATVLHEIAHHWYGNQVTPSDWRDLWMNEGMATYLQLMWEAEQSGEPVDVAITRVADYEAQTRRDAGPPGAYDRDQFAAGNVYYGGALLWHAVRRELGDRLFWRIARAWPRAHDDVSTDRETLIAFWSREAGRPLRPLFTRWLTSPTTPR